ncbi:MAG: 2-oxoacid:acceptor oxidoreductase subunit alpha [Flavobacteriales bacterium AspAUS03]
MEKILDQVTILFAGNSGDGMQLIGNQFTHTAAWMGNDVNTFPDFPAEIRAPHGTIAGVSGFQVHFGSVEISSPGDLCDVLVVMNAAALKKNLSNLKKGGIIIADNSGFIAKKVLLAGYSEEQNPLKKLSDYKIYEIDFLVQTRQLLQKSPLSKKDKDTAKNMFTLGFIYWLYNRPLDYTEQSLNKKFQKSDELLQANIQALKAGYHFGETSEIFTERFTVGPAKMKPGVYRNITGNQALALGLVAACEKASLELFYSGYPITPASDILHHLSRYKKFNIKTFQAEDEIAAITSAIGASYAGNLGVTATSGPGMALKQEGLGLALMLELPLVIINVQRGGPSTGLPTKTEQADLMQALHGRNGEAPIPVLAARSPAHCFQTAFHAVKIAIEYMTPVIVLSEGYLANGTEPWKFLQRSQLNEITPYRPKDHTGKSYQPYQRDTRGVRPWVVPGMTGYENRIGSLEKEHLSGDVSYDPQNHQLMINLRQSKIDKITESLPKQQIDTGTVEGQLLLLSWGSTYGVILEAMKQLMIDAYPVSHTHLEYLYPLPYGLKELISRFKKVLIPELNNRQLIHIIRDRFLIDAIPLNKVQGVPFTVAEIVEKVRQII